MNRNWTGKLLLFAYISWKNLCSHTFKASLEKVVVRILRKWRQNAWFLGILSTWTPSNSYFFFLYKMLEKRLWNTFLLYVVVKIRQLVNEISSFPEVPYKRGDLKNSENSQINIFASVPFLIKLQAMETCNCQKQLLEMFCKKRCF